MSGRGFGRGRGGRRQKVRGPAYYVSKNAGTGYLIIEGLPVFPWNALNMEQL